VEAHRNQVVSLDWGVIRPPVKAPFSERLNAIYDGLSAVISEHRPEAAAVEGIFQSGGMKNVQSVLKLGHARGVALLAVARQEVPLAEYPPAEVKKSLVGHGRAQKWQVQQMVRTLLGLSELPSEDAADALAVAICHGYRLLKPMLRGL